LSVLLLFTTAEAAKPKKINCLECHDGLDRGKSVHPALAMGCNACHSNIDASDVPHKNKGKIAKGLSASQPELCYGCHSKDLFLKKNVHPAVAMGCTTCHNPHASNAESLLAQPVGKLCTSCHEKQSSGKHIMAAFSAVDDHPMRGRTDPAKSKRELSCISCHNPHSSSQQKLFVNETVSPANLCLMCHQKISVRAN